MQLKTLLREDIERERTYLHEQEVGSEEYVESLKRLGALEDKLFDLEKFESETVYKEKQFKDEKKDKRTKNVIDIAKFVIGTVIIPGIGLVCITATEKETTFCGALKDYTKLFIPKKLI